MSKDPYDDDDDDDVPEDKEHWWQSDNFWETAQQVSDAVTDIIHGHGH
jgi:hypothetical protein